MRIAIRLLLAAVVAACLLLGMGGPAFAQVDEPGTQQPSDAQQDQPDGSGAVDVLQVSGLVDPILVDAIGNQIRKSVESDSLVLVLQLNSSDSVVPDEKLAELVAAIDDATIPVAVWVGPSGADALGGAAHLLGPADHTGLAHGGTIGELGDHPELPPDPLGPSSNLVVNRKVGRTDALELGLVDSGASIIGEYLLDLVDDGVIPDVTSVDTSGEIPTRRIEPPVRFHKVPFFENLMHTVASPAMAYLLLLAGLGLLVLEFYTAGVGIAGVTGAGAVVLAGYGLGVLPIENWALVLIVLSAFGYAVDIQTGVPRFWTVAATVMLLIGTLGLYEGVSMSWLTAGAGIIGMLVLMIGALPSLVRSRFSTNTIGREWMIGEIGVAETAVDPNGTVSVQDAKWRAFTNRATPLAPGQELRVVAIDGVYLEVEPLEGAARDHRERRRA